MRALLLVVTVAACYSPRVQSGVPCSPDGTCPSGQSCVAGVCNGDGVEIDACLATACTNDELTDCTGTHACSYGCAVASPPRCMRLAPSNGLSPALLDGATASLTSGSLSFDTDTGEIRDGATTIIRAAGTGLIGGIRFDVATNLAVFAVHDARIPIAATWRATGPRPLAIFAATSIVVDGTFDVGAPNTIAVAGGTNGSIGNPRTMCEGNDGRYKTSLPAGAGGGGGGGATAGGDGAATAADSGGATSGGAGGALCSTVSTIPLHGGFGGGAGGTENMIIRGGGGGGGGGALALVAMSSITIHGSVAAPGAGGETIGNGSGGGGGGGGGAILIETLDAIVDGALTANGGGGGAASNASASATTGERGHISDAMPALGGASGGRGGALGMAPTNGATNTGGGGAGGGAGRVEIRARSMVTAGAVSSPAATISTAALE